jgi:hypothetical protein
MPEIERGSEYSEIAVDEQAVKMRIGEALMAAPTLSELWEEIHRQEKLTNEFTLNKIDAAEYRQRLIDLNEKAKGIVELETLDEFIIALEYLGVKGEELYEVVSHEQAHFETADELELSPAYMIRLYMIDKIRFGKCYGVISDYDSLSTNEQIREANMRVSMAPEFLSETDLKVFEGTEFYDELRQSLRKEDQ